ncbi:MAG: hypothetical protein JW997_01155 [Actinobacteria bacterium]|nr:hypothetical protein [Actinomycetota bacterium]
MNEWSDNQLTQIAVLYYDKDISQKGIGEMMGLSKMTISRMLQKAKELKLVSTKIILPFSLNRNLSQSIESIYNLEKVYVIKVKENQNIPRELGKALAFYMGINDLNNKVIGIGVGNTLGSLIEYLTPIKTKNTHVIQLMGGMEDVTNFNPFTIVQEMSKKLNAKGTFLTAYALAENKDIRDSIISASQIGNELKKADIAIFGIGAMERGTVVGLNLLNNTTIDKVKSKGAVGDILGHFFDANGNFIQSELENRIVSIKTEHLKKFKQRIAIAGGKYKTESIKGALFSGIISTLVIDEGTGSLLI